MASTCSHAVKLIALYNIYFEQLLATKPDEKALLNESSALLREAYQKEINTKDADTKELREAVKKTILTFESRAVSEKLEQFEGAMNKIQH